MLWGLKLSKSQYRLTVVSYGEAPREGIVMLPVGVCMPVEIEWFVRPGLCDVGVGHVYRARENTVSIQSGPPPVWHAVSV